MARCPVCSHDVRTPFFLNLNGWAHLACPACKARLEMKPPRIALLAPIMGPLFVLARRGPIFEVLAFAFTVSTILLLLIESMRPKLRLRTKPLPHPEISLNIDKSPR